MSFLNWLAAHATAVIFWQVVAFVGMVLAVVWAARTQQKPENGVNFLELISEPNSARLAPERFAFVGAFVITSVGFIFGVTRPSATVEGIAFLMATYGGLWVTGVAVKKFSERPPAPIAAAAPIPPATQVNVNPPPGG